MAKIREEEVILRMETRVILDMTVNEAEVLRNFLDTNKSYVTFASSQELIHILRQLNNLDCFKREAQVNTNDVWDEQHVIRG